MTGGKGKIVGGRYRLEDLLGSGGMGEVWRATHLELESPVAIKLIQARGKNPDHIVARFLREAKAAAAVRHRNVVRITDFGTIEDGQPFMVMELLEGASLGARLDGGAPMPVSDLLDVMAQCLSGLAAVHAAGLIHRDLKPENIFLVDDADGPYPKLLDFGVSRSVPGSGSSGKGAMTTSEGILVGTPHYMSPEQARGLRDIDHRTDLYAAGIILYEALTGKLPFDSPNVGDLIMAVAAGGATPLVELRPDLGIELSNVISTAMTRDREERYPDARSMRAALLSAGRAALAGFMPRMSSADITGQLGVVRAVRESADTLDSIPPVPRPASDPSVPAVAALDSRRSVPPASSSTVPPPDARGRGMVFWGATALFVVLLVAGGVGLAFSGSDHDGRAGTHATHATTSTPPLHDVAPAHDPEGETHVGAPPVPQSALVTLHGLPPGATVLVDGAETTTSGETVTLAQDGHDHALEVRAPGFVAWRAHVTASADVTLSLELVAAPAQGTHDAVATTHGGHHHGEVGEPGGTATQQATTPPDQGTGHTTAGSGVYTDPGF